MTITAMLRVKNEARWLAEVLASIQPLTRDIVVFDDHSEDRTRSIAHRFGCEVLESPYPVALTDETRDKNWLLSHVRRTREPDYILCVDGDEVLERDAAARIMAKVRPGLAVFSFPIRYVWNDRQHYRADGVYGRYSRASMFACAGQAPSIRYRSSGAGCNFHCGNIPADLKGAGCTLTAELLHLGYMHAEDRVRKFHWYREHDPGNQHEDGYVHMILGDLPEYPATMARLHGGPLKVFTFPQSKWPEYDQS